MNALQAFNYEGQNVRTTIIDEDPWFVTKDVCGVLGIVNVSDAVSRVDSDGVGTTEVIDSMGRKQTASAVNESALYELIFQSRRPEAKDFRRWVTKEVLPSIRKTGSYGQAPAELSRIDILQMALESENARITAEARAKELEAPANAWGIMVSASGDYAVEEAAKILSRDPEIEIGRNRLFTLMQELGWTYRQGPRKNWHAYQTQVDAGRLVLRMSAAFLNARTGDMENPAPTIRITAKGLESLRADALGRLAVAS